MHSTSDLTGSLKRSALRVLRPSTPPVPESAGSDSSAAVVLLAVSALPLSLRYRAGPAVHYTQRLLQSRPMQRGPSPSSCPVLLASVQQPRPAVSDPFTLPLALHARTGPSSNPSPKARHLRWVQRGMIGPNPVRAQPVRVRASESGRHGTEPSGCPGHSSRGTEHYLTFHDTQYYHAI